MQRLDPEHREESKKKKTWAWCLTALAELLSFRLSCSLLSYDLPPEVFKMASKRHVETWEEIWHTLFCDSSWGRAVYRFRGLLPTDEFEKVERNQRQLDGHRRTIWARMKGDVRRTVLFDYAL